MLNIESLLLKLERTIATLTLNRPESLNALNGEIWRGLSDAAEIIVRNPEIRVVILTGAGDRSFSAGLDLKMVAAGMPVMADRQPRSAFEQVKNMKDAFSAYEELSVPVIAAINGYCCGGGLQLALACDIRIASDTATFWLPEVSYGIIPDMGGTQRLPRLVGSGMARELIYTGGRIDAVEALRIGLVNHVYPLNQLMIEARNLAEEIARQEPQAVQAAKRALNVALSYPLAIGLDFETSMVNSLSGVSRLREAGGAFAKRKAPS